MTGNKNDKTEVTDSTEPIPSQADVTLSETAKMPRRSQRTSAQGDRNDGALPGTDRRQFMVKLSLFGAASAATYATPKIVMAAGAGSLSPVSSELSGTGTILSTCGTSTYSFSGSTSTSVVNGVVRVLSFVVTGQFVSGVDIGPTRLENDGTLSGPVNPNDTFDATGNVAYTDDFNTALRIGYTFSGTIQNGAVLSLNGAGDALGMCTVGGPLNTVDIEIISLWL